MDKPPSISIGDLSRFLDQRTLNLDEPDTSDDGSTDRAERKPPHMEMGRRLTRAKIRQLSKLVLLNIYTLFAEVVPPSPTSDTATRLFNGKKYL
jgi:hypothetical protein